MSDDSNKAPIVGEGKVVAWYNETPAAMSDRFQRVLNLIVKERNEFQARVAELEARRDALIAENAQVRAMLDAAQRRAVEVNPATNSAEPHKAPVHLCSDPSSSCDMSGMEQAAPSPAVERRCGTCKYLCRLDFSSHFDRCCNKGCEMYARLMHDTDSCAAWVRNLGKRLTWK